MIVLVFGGRDYMGDVQLDITLLIHGAARGADIRAAHYVMSKGIHAAGIPALWDFYGYGAGTKRNEAMTWLSFRAGQVRRIC